jgi:hypothetical protein
MTDPLTVLRTLDPAGDDGDAHGPRARADLARILATEPRPAPSPRRRKVVLRVTTAAAAAAAVVAGVILVPSLTGGDQAFATWTGTPSAPSTGEATDLADACRDSQRDGAGSGFGTKLDRAATAVAERRGAWSLVLLVGDGGFSAMCITDESTPLFKSSIGHIGTPSDHQAPDPREATAHSLGTGMIDGEELSVAAGAVGADVTGLTYASAEHGAVAATVAHGHFAFWLPGGELEDASRDGVAVTATYRDGTTATITIGLG